MKTLQLLRFSSIVSIIVTAFAVTQPQAQEDIEPILRANPSNAQLLGELVEFTASVETLNPTEFRFAVRDPLQQSATVRRDWGPPQWTWTTSGLAAGRYRVRVDARQVGNSATETFRWLTYELVTQAPVNRVDLNPVDLRSPQPVGTPINFLAVADSPFGVEYQFRVRGPADASATLLRDWGPGAWQWDTSLLPGGLYFVQVRARVLGSPANFEAARQIGFRLTGIQFEDVTSAAGLGRIGDSWGGAWGDFNGDGFPDLWATNHRQAPSLYVNDGEGRFENVIDAVWSGFPFGDNHGAAWADFDNDGDQDLIELAGGPKSFNAIGHLHFNHLYVNRGGMLVDEAVARGVSYEISRGRNPQWIDWNQDGLLDVLLTAMNPDGEDPPAKMFLQSTAGTFEEISEAVGVGVSSDESSNYAVLTGLGTQDQTTILLGSTRFPRRSYSPPTGRVAIDSPRTSRVWDLAVADLNGDLISDIYLARNWPQLTAVEVRDQRRVDFFFLSENGRDRSVQFRSAGEIELYLSGPPISLGAVFIGADGVSPRDFPFSTSVQCPLNGAGIQKIDCVSFVMSPDDPRIVGSSDPNATEFGIFISYDPSTEIWTILSHNETSNRVLAKIEVGQLVGSAPISDVGTTNFPVRAGNLRDVFLIGAPDGGYAKQETGPRTAAASVAAGDFDNDMDIDLYVVETRRIRNLPNSLYLNRGDGTFDRVVGRFGAEGSSAGVGDAVTMADFDVDGFLDLYVTSGRGSFPFNQGPEQLFRNLGNTNNWLEIDLEGTVANRDAIGSKVYIVTPDGRIQMRERNGHMHARGQHSNRLHFGLGANNLASLVVVQWPDGHWETHRGVAANQVILITEGR